MWCSHEEFVEHRDPNKKRSLFSATVGKIKIDKKTAVSSDWTGICSGTAFGIRVGVSSYQRKKNLKKY